MEYDDSTVATELAARTREFVDEVVIPVEREHLGSGPVDPATVEELRAEARERGLYAPQVSEAFGGLGLGFRDVLPAFEAAGRSLLGPAAIRVDAPDEGNMHTLEMAGTDEQKERWLRPLVDGDVASAFAMTEPRQGAGSDPKMIRTTARREPDGAIPADNGDASASPGDGETSRGNGEASRDGDEWVIDGHKWWTTNGAAADVLLVMVRTDEDVHPYEGCSIFLVPADAPGVEVVREIPHLGEGVTGTSHAEIRFDGVRVPAANLLGEEGEGFALAQRRLGPARLTHCMRFAGMAERALDVAKAYASERRAFDEPLAEKQALRHRVADAETELHAVRTMVRHAADRVAADDRARVEVSMAKLFAANVVGDVVDLAVQICGASGVGKDLPLADFYEAVRAFRIVDGADEVHRRVVAREAFDDVDASEVDHLTRFGE